VPDATSDTGSDKRQVPDAVCLGCGCLCDDLVVETTATRVVGARNACDKGLWWLTSDAADRSWIARIRGDAAELNAAIEHGVNMLKGARYPLIYGGADLDCVAQRRAIAIADRLRGCVDFCLTDEQRATLRAVQSVGQVTCTLGEIANRSNMVVYWGADPATTHPRHGERYALAPMGEFVPRGRADRTCVVVTDREVATEAWADEVLRIRSGRHFEAIAVLRALATGAVLEASEVKRQTGAELSTWLRLLGQMKDAQYGAIFYGDQLGAATAPATPASESSSNKYDAGIGRPPHSPACRGEDVEYCSSHLIVEALLRLVMELNEFARFVSLSLGGGGNSAGAEETMTWTTGYPYGVSFAQGYPRSFDREHLGEAMLARGEVDAALLVGVNPAELNHAAQRHLETIPRVLIDWRSETAASRADVAVRIARPGIETGGTAYRADGVPLPLRPVRLSAAPAAASVLEALERSILATRETTIASREA